MMITRHFVDVGSRRVHYRQAGEGPVLLMVHQSPRSSEEYEPLMRAWSGRFTCIAPDSPGFGQSEPFDDPEAPIETFADGMIELLDALGIDRVAAYGFHSGGIILVNAVKRHPSRFSALAIGGYAIWTAEERQIFSAEYLPPFRPQPYGEHLTWAWNRILEQTWFFPWFAVEPATRMPVAHDDPVKVHETIRDLLDSGDWYRTGYGAVLRATRDIPSPDEATVPVLISAYDGDPLQEHIDRLGSLPQQWTALKVATPAKHQQVSVEHLSNHALAGPDRFEEATDEGFLRITTADYDGLIHWCGQHGATLTVHGPGRALELVDDAKLAIDLPGHGLSDPWDAAIPDDTQPWRDVIEAAAQALGTDEIVYEAVPEGEPELLFPDLQPDRFGTYLTKAWSVVRAGHLFSPWYKATADAAIDFDPANLTPERLAIEHRALVRCSAAREWLAARRKMEQGA